MTDKKCNDYLYIQPYESCTYNALNTLKTNDIFSNDVSKFDFDKNNIYNKEYTTNYIDANTKFREDKNNKIIYKYENSNLKDLCNPTNKNETEYHVNCAIATKNPLFTYNANKKKCVISTDIQLPESLMYVNEGGDVYVSRDTAQDPEGNYKYDFKESKAYCENKWYEWITIPNYHFGNGYKKDAGIFSREDVKKCYRPCPMNYIPEIGKNGSYICRRKDEALNGVYAKKMDYNPISLINLIGNSKKNLNLLYINILFSKLKEFHNNINNSFYEINNNNNRFKKLKEIIKTDENSFTNTAFNDMLNVIKNNIIYGIFYS